MSSIRRSYEWIETEYNNQNNLTTFLSFDNNEKINFSWMLWNNATNPDTNSPWSWNFKFPNGTGYYEFYSIGNKSGSPNETAPVNADANCYYLYVNSAPTQSYQLIWDNFSAFLLNNTDIRLNPISLNVTISDLEGSNMNITILTNESGIWNIVNQSSGSGLSNGTYSFTNTSWIDTYNKKYYISFNLTDGTDWTNETFNFTTITTPPIGIPYKKMMAQGNSFGLKEWRVVNYTYFWDLVDYYADWMVEESTDNITWFRNNTNLSVDHDRDSNDSNDKLTLNFTAPKNSYYRIVLYFKKPILAYWDNSTFYEYTLKLAANATENYTMYFNWSDYAGSDEVNITSCDYGIKTIGGNDYFYWIVTTNNPLNADESLQIDPTFGNSDEGSSGLDLENTIRGSRFQVSDNASAVSISAYLYYKSSEQNQYNVKAAIYNDNENLVGSTNEITVYDTQGDTNWHTFTLNSPQYLAANNYYYLVVWADDQPGSSAIQLRYSSASPNYHYVDQTYGTWPSSVSFTSPGSSYEHNIYCIYTYNNVSIQSGEAPTNESTDICPITSLSVTCIDNEDDTMNATWWSNSSGSWAQFATNTSISNNTIITQTNSNFSLPGTTYYWRVILSDGEGGISNETYHFTTNNNPTQSGESPTSGTTDICPDSSSLYVICSDADSDTMTAEWWSNSSGTWGLFASNTSISSGTNITQTNNNFSSSDTTYYWSVNLSDGCKWTNVTYNFTTNYAPTQTDPWPENEQAGVPLTPTLNITISDLDNDIMTAYWLSNSTGIWEIFGTNSSVSTGTTIYQTNSNFSEITTIYWWSVNVTDGCNWTNVTYSFTTSNAPLQKNQSIWDGFSCFLLNNTDVPVNITSFNITISDIDGQKMNVTILTNSSGSWSIVNQSSGAGLSNGTHGFTNTSWVDSYDTKYWISFNVTDGICWTNQTFNFTTVSNPPTGEAYEHQTAGGNVFGANNWNETNHTFFWDFVDYYGIWAVEESSDNVTWFKNNTVLDISTSQSSDNERKKFTLNFTANKYGYYRLVMNFKKPLLAYWDNSTFYEYSLKFAVNATENYTMYFNWSDYVGSDEAATTTCNFGVKTVDGDDYFYWIVTTNYPLNADESLQIDPTFGDENEGTSGDNLEDTIRGSIFQMPENGNANSISAYLYYETSGPNFYTVKAAIYNNNSVLLGSTEERSLSNTDGIATWETFTFSSSPFLTGSENYYIVIWADLPSGSNTIELRYSLVTNNNNYSSQSYGAWPSPVSFLDQSGDYQYNIYCTYTPNNLSVISFPGPANESSGILPRPVCNVTVYDQDGGTVDVYFYENTTGDDIWVLQQTNSSVDVTSAANVEWDNYTNVTVESTKYWWRVVVIDENGGTVEEYYHFTTVGISVSIDPATWHQGVLTVGSSNETTAFYFELTNSGSTDIDLQIKATNATNATTGAKWKLNDTVGLDNYSLQYNLSDGGTTWTNINLTYDTFVNNLGSSSSKTFDLKLILATLSSKSDPLQITLTFRSVLS
ncbi:MAG: hypothetical protein JSU91_05335 [Thermoplasmatales archaeon]|nr:MAG: hypothetical protein JSU91_05335 [Thermoplasmatales archaeon]